MMERRVFLSICAVATLWSAVDGAGATPLERLSPDIYALIASVQQHLFPDGTLLPSAKTFHATTFLQSTLFHKTFDKDIREFVIEGAKKLQEREKNLFLTYNEEQREEALRAFEETTMGRSWLSRIMILSFEGLLSDPLYGGNYGESGWRALGTKGGEPRPSVEYASV